MGDTSRFVRHAELPFEGGILEFCVQDSEWVMMIINADDRSSLVFEIKDETLLSVAALGTESKGLKRPMCKRGRVGTLHAQFSPRPGMIHLGIAVPNHRPTTIEVSAREFWNKVFYIKTGQDPDGQRDNKKTQVAS